MNLSKPIPSQAEVDWSKPEEHLSWAMKNMPVIAGTGAVTNPGFLRQWSEHLVKAGAVHVDYLRTLADDDGNIHVSQLPKQTIKFQQAFKGPRHTYNNAARWVSSDTPDIAPTQIQDLSKATLLEQQIYAEQLRRLGVIPADPVHQHSAHELNEGH